MATSLHSSPLALTSLLSLYLLLPLYASSMNPFTSRAATIQYWNYKVPNNAPHPEFLVSLFSPLPASLLSSTTPNISVIPSLCLSAHLLCPNSASFQTLSSDIIHPNVLLYGYFKAYSFSVSGLFFRESELKEGNVMLMPDIKNKIPIHSFLPRSIADRIPFEAEVVKSLFGLEPGTILAKAVDKTVADCQMSPMHEEMKRCTTSAEDMIDFAVEVLGNDIVVRTTESPNGTGGPILIGKVHGINGGKVTRSVSCHQMLFPYMVYHCHSVPKIRVYEAEILSIETKEKINKGVAICHLDTSTWSAGHAAFQDLGGKPGQIEVCHWIPNGDMTWVIADQSKTFDDLNQYIKIY